MDRKVLRENLEKAWPVPPMAFKSGIDMAAYHQSELDAILPVIEEQIKVDGDTSDGYHTFDELYEHRMALTLGLMKNCPAISWRSKNHHPDGDPMFEGFFIVGMDLPTGVITYHYKLEHWDKFAGIKELDYAPLWDGHTPADVVKRLNEASKLI